MGSMSLNIKNERVHEMVRRLAELTGQSQTGAVEDAVRRRLDEVDAGRITDERRRRDEFDAALKRLQALPDVGPSYEEIMDDMYDDLGLPR